MHSVETWKNIGNAKGSGLGNSPRIRRLAVPHDLLNPKSVGFEFDGVDDYTTLPSFKSLRSGVFVLLR